MYFGNYTCVVIISLDLYSIYNITPHSVACFVFVFVFVYVDSNVIAERGQVPSRSCVSVDLWEFV